MDGFSSVTSITDLNRPNTAKEDDDDDDDDEDSYVAPCSGVPVITVLMSLGLFSSYIVFSKQEK
jgi:hypothetical protein